MEDRASFVRRVPTAAHPDSSSFRVSLDRVTLRDWSWTAVCEGPSDPVCGYFPPVRGVVATVRDLTLSKWHYPGPWTPDIVPTLVSERHYGGSGASLLRHALDTSGATVQPGIGRFSSGWMASGSAGAVFMGTNTSLPKITAGSDRTSPAPTHAVRIAAASAPDSRVLATAGCDAKGQPQIAVEPARSLILGGFVRTGGGSGNVSVSARFARFDGSPTADGASPTVLLELPAHAVGFPSWEPLMLGVTAPGDAARMALEFGATAGAALEVYALDLK